MPPCYSEHTNPTIHDLGTVIKVHLQQNDLVQILVPTVEEGHGFTLRTWEKQCTEKWTAQSPTELDQRLRELETTMAPGEAVLLFKEAGDNNIGILKIKGALE